LVAKHTSYRGVRAALTRARERPMICGNEDEHEDHGASRSLMS
jgi:hypothetical protein